LHVGPHLELQRSVPGPTPATAAAAVHRARDDPWWRRWQHQGRNRLGIAAYNGGGEKGADIAWIMHQGRQLWELHLATSGRRACRRHGPHQNLSSVLQEAA